MWLIAVLTVVIFGITCSANFRLQQENSELRREVVELANIKSPVNCPTPEWFSGRSDIQ